MKIRQVSNAKNQARKTLVKTAISKTLRKDQDKYREIPISSNVLW